MPHPAKFEIREVSRRSWHITIPIYNPTVARVNNPGNAWLFTPEMGVDVGLNQAELLAYLIAEEMSPGEMMTLHKLRQKLEDDPTLPNLIHTEPGVGYRLYCKEEK